MHPILEKLLASGPVVTNDINKVLYACGRAAKQLELPLILNGDLLHTGSYDHATLHSLTMFLRSFHDVDMYINTGNYDLESGHSMIYPLVQFRDNPKHVVVTHPFISPIGGSKYNFAFMPFMSKEETIEHLKKLPLEIVDNYKYILIIHNTFASSRFANNAITASGISPNLALFKKYFMVIGSDVHKYQEFMHGRGFYPSSLIPLNFGERTKEHGFHIIDLKNKIRYFVIPNALRFIQIEHSRLKTLSKTELKSKVRGNIIKVVDDGTTSSGS